MRIHLKQKALSPKKKRSILRGNLLQYDFATYGRNEEYEGPKTHTVAHLHTSIPPDQ